MATATAGLSQIGQIAITVRDLPRSVAFYRDVLGLKFLFEAPPKLAFFDCGGIRLMLTPREKPGSDHGASIIYKVPDIHATHALLLSRGVIFDAEPHLIAKLPGHDLWMAFFRDCDQNQLALMSEVRG